MVSKTWLKTIFRELRQNLGRFISIFAIVALGVGFLSGLLATTPDMKVSMDRYFDHANMMDVFIKATQGLVAGDVAELRALPDVELVVPAYVTDALVNKRVGSQDETLAARIYALPLERMNSAYFVNRMELVEGVAPTRDNECLVQQGGGYFDDVALGSILNITQENLDFGAFERFESLSDVYRVTEFVVTGIVSNPLYVSTERESSAVGGGRLNTVLYVRENVSALPAYTDCYLTLKNTRALTAFTAAYQARVDRARGRIETLGEERAALRQKTLLEDARALALSKVEDATGDVVGIEQRASEELGEARSRLDVSRGELEAGEAALVEGEQQLADGRARFAEEAARVRGELREQETTLRNAKLEIEAARVALAERKRELAAVKDDVESTRKSWFKMLFASAREGVAAYDAGRAAYEDGVKTVMEQDAEIQRGWALLSDGMKTAEEELARSKEALDQAELDIISNRWQLADARRRLTEGEAEYERGRVEAAEGLSAIERARTDGVNTALASVLKTESRWYVLDRNSNVGCANYKVNAEKIDAVARVFPLFFLLVAALVALTSMTRMVAEERVQIGVLKALGFRKRAILAKYLIYCGITGVSGSIVGMFAGFWGLPIIIYNAFATIYHLPPLITEFNWGFGLIACALVLFSIAGATVYACYHALWEKPASLMLPRPPRAGKRIFLEYIPAIWTQLKFTHKVTARNLIRQKRHFFMTITGIAGCTALMVAGFGLRDSLVDIARTQFEEILKYDFQLLLNSNDLFASSQRELSEFTDHGAFHTESSVLIGKEKRVNATLITPENANSLSLFINLRTRQSKQPLLFSADSVILTEKAAADLGLTLGSRFTLENAAGVRATFTLSGITENYVGVNCYIGRNAYEREFSAASFRTIWVHTGLSKRSEQDALASKFLSDRAVMSVEFTSQVQASYTRLLDSIGFVVIVLIAAAGALAMIVLYNLTNINIGERTREIATLRVLGFHKEEAAAYIFREITILSIIGAIAGLALGVPLHRFIIGVAENTDLMFGRRIGVFGFIVAFVMTMVFSVLINRFMLRKIRAIDMIAAMKVID